VATAVLGVGVLCAPAGARAQWTVEAIPGEGIVGAPDLAFDSAGIGLLTWAGFHQDCPPPGPAGLPAPCRAALEFTGLDVRDASGTWRARPRLGGVEAGRARVFLYGNRRALLIADQTPQLPPADTISTVGFPRSRLVYAFGRSDGSVGRLHRLAEGDTLGGAAVNRRGDALVTFYNDRTHATFIMERTAGHAFSSPRPFPAGAPGGSPAINDRGDRVLAWWGPQGIYAQVRRPGHGWGPTVLAERVTPVGGSTLAPAVTPSGRVVIAWATADFREGSSTIPIAAGATLLNRAGGWHPVRLERSSKPDNGYFPVGTPAIPIIDTNGHIYVTWTGVAGNALAVKIEQITTRAGHPTVLSDAIPGAAVEDAAAGPRGSIIVSWTVFNPGSTPIVYASLRRSHRPFDPPERLTPVGVTTPSVASHAAFAPLTGQAVVIWSSSDADHHNILHASVSPPPA